MTVDGKIKMIGETGVYGNNGFRKRECVVTTDEQYPQHILIEFVQDKCDILDGCNVGQNVKVDINLRGREWTNPQGEVKYFNTIQGWRVNVVGGSNQQQTQTDFPEQQHIPDNVGNEDEEDHDDLPF